ncbi:sensor histidine kinase [Streptomyces sp. NPDC001663]|uniref:sensor histidine kinase n=1 Tax=Streptomyces sp. NPDC001663 TaxID=3364597 RepID=UPI0036AD78FC
MARGLLRPTGPLPRPTLRKRLFDAGLAVALAVVSTWYTMGDGYEQSHRHSMVGLLDLVFVASAALAWRRRYPLTVLWTVMAAAALTPDSVARITFYHCVIAAYSAAAYSPYRAPTLAGLVGTVALIGRPDTPRSPYAYFEPTVPTQYVPLLVSVPLVVAAVGLRTWRRRAAETRTRLTTVQREQTEALRRAVEHERARIARELHDVVTHNVSVMVIQAGAARTIMETSPDEAREALLAVEAGGRAAMGELRHVMGLLTPDADDADDAESLAPQPGLGQLGALVARMRNAGLPVELTVTGTPPRLPSPAVELAAYRVVQEALTNIVKHAAGAEARVRVSYGDKGLDVEVTDTGGPPGPAAATGNGRGLIGLRERLAVYGGTLRTGPRPLGGYRVHALIPLEHS